MKRLLAILLTGVFTGVAWAQLPMHAPPLGTPPSHPIPFVGPLDAISAGGAATVVACYAFRACSAAIATALTKEFNIQKTGPSNTDITVLANGNWDAATAGTFCVGVTNCTIAKTYDQTAGAHTLTVPGSQSSIATTCGLTTDCILISGNNGFGTGTVTSLTDPVTFSWVGKRTGNTGSFGEAISLRSASSFSCDSGSNNSTNNVFNEGTSLFTKALTDNTWGAVQATVVNGTSAAVINVNGSETTGTTGHCNSTATEIGVGTNPPSGGTTFTGNFVEAILFSSALSSADRTALCRNQQAYYGKANFPANC